MEWVSNHSRNTQLALLQGHIDIALTYERDQEHLAASEGWSDTIGCIFHDHFCLVGPVSDPARIFSTMSLDEALLRIVQSQALFHSRADSSATMWKERSLWQKIGLTPWNSTDATQSWYKMNLLSPMEALIDADEAGAYIMIDRSTLLALTRSQHIHRTTVFFEPLSRDDVLMNNCYALLPISQSRQRKEACQSFLEYLLSERGQQNIASFGKREGDGYSSFARLSDGFARTFLRGGSPEGGNWVHSRAKPNI